MANDQGQNPWSVLAGDKALYGMDPEQNMAGEQKIQGSGQIRLEEALKGRYGADQKGFLNTHRVGDAFQKEVGLDPYPIRVNTNSPELASQHWQDILNKTGMVTLGDYSNREKQIRLLGTAHPDDRAEALVHELAHAADDTFNTSDSSLASPAQHHKYFVNFEPEMAQIIQAQAAREVGMPVNQGILRRYPYLQGVNPQSSNRLANPWSFYKDPRFTPPGPDDGTNPGLSAGPILP